MGRHKETANTTPESYELQKTFREFLDAGLKVSVNTDNRTVSNTSLTKELEFIQKNYGIRDEEILQMMKNAIDTAFADDSIKDKICKMLK